MGPARSDEVCCDRRGAARPARRVVVGVGLASRFAAGNRPAQAAIVCRGWRWASTTGRSVSRPAGGPRSRQWCGTVGYGPARLGLMCRGWHESAWPEEMWGGRHNVGAANTKWRDRHWAGAARKDVVRPIQGRRGQGATGITPAQPGARRSGQSRPSKPAVGRYDRHGVGVSMCNGAGDRRVTHDRPKKPTPPKSERA